MVEKLESMTGIQGGWRVKFGSTTPNNVHWSASNAEFTRLAEAKSPPKDGVGPLTVFTGVLNKWHNYGADGAHVQFPNVWGLELHTGSYEDAIKAWRMEAIGR